MAPTNNGKDRTMDCEYCRMDTTAKLQIVLNGQDQELCESCLEDVHVNLDYMESDIPTELADID